MRIIERRFFINKTLIMIRKIILLTIFIPFIISCEEVDKILETTGLSTEEVVEGLKTALNVGTDSSSTALSIQDGYYGNALVKIPLPPEIEQIESILKRKSLNPLVAAAFNAVASSYFEDLRKSINRAAEESAKEAAPIFKESITSMSISDGWEILNGNNPADSGLKSAGFDSTAATQYFNTTTRTPLTNLYAPKIDVVLGKDLGLGFSANTAFSTLKTNYNNAYDAAILAASLIGGESYLTGQGLTKITTPTIGNYCTGKALDGLFKLVGQEEVKIRRDPWAWIETAVGDILVKVFGGSAQQ